MKKNRRNAEPSTVRIIESDDGICRLNCNCPRCLVAREEGRKPVHEFCQVEFCVHGPDIDRKFQNQ